MCPSALNAAWRNARSDEPAWQWNGKRGGVDCASCRWDVAWKCLDSVACNAAGRFSSGSPCVDIPKSMYLLSVVSLFVALGVPTPGSARTRQEAPGSPRMPREAPGSRRKPPDAPRSPGRPPIGPKMPQDSPKRPPAGPKMPQDSPKMAPRWPQGGPKMAPIWPQEASREGQDGLKNH